MTPLPPFRLGDYWVAMNNAVYITLMRRMGVRRLTFHRGVDYVSER